jgi:plasmid stabilization system protein ParE
LSHRIRVAPQAAAQIRAAASWWRKNRTKAPEAFDDELERGFELSSQLPFAGETVSHPKLAGIRRILLGRVRYHLYYHLPDEADTVDILALWHTSRGSAPDL